jgi:hypothetical protein
MQDRAVFPQAGVAAQSAVKAAQSAAKAARSVVRVV